jgi:DNA-binding CsgD family transcriptional regulator
LLQDPAVRQIALTPFSATDVRSLAKASGRGSLPLYTARRIAEQAAGNVLYICAILDALSDPGSTIRPDQPLPVPADYASVVRDRLRACAAAGSALTRAAAVFNTPRPLHLVASVANVTDPLTALDNAVAAGLLQPTAGSEPVRLAHPLARAAVLQAIPSRSRARLQARAAEQLEPIDVAAALRLRVAAATGVDAELAQRVAEQAHADFAARAWDRAVEGFRAAARLSQPGGKSEREQLLWLVEALVLANDTSAAPELTAQLSRYPPSAWRDYCLARLRTAAGDLAGATEWSRSAWQRTQDEPDTDPQLSARISAELARTALTTGHAAEAAEWAQRTLASAVPDSVAYSDSAGTRLLALAMQGDYAPAFTALAGLPAQVPEPAPAELDALIGRGLISLWTGDLHQAMVDLGTVVRVTRRSGPAHLYLGAAAYLSDAAYRTGDWARAIDEAEAALATAADLDLNRATPMLHGAAAAPLAAQGAFAAAAEHVAAAARAAETVGDMQTKLWAGVAGVRLAQARGDHHDVIRAAVTLERIAALDGVREPGIQPWQCSLAAALVRTGDFTRAETVLTDAEQLAIARQHLIGRLEVARVRALLSGALGNLAEAGQLLDAAASVRADATGQPFDAARFDLTHGSVLRQLGERAKATTVLRRAHAAFAALHAQPWLERAAAELARCGVRGKPPRAAASPRPTPAELAVTQLVISGMTNREIASQLVISVKTVEYHLSNVYAKLGIRSRTQLAARLLAREGLP